MKIDPTQISADLTEVTENTGFVLWQSINAMRTIPHESRASAAIGVLLSIAKMVAHETENLPFYRQCLTQELRQIDGLAQDGGRLN